MQKIQPRAFLVFVSTLFLFLLAACITREGAQSPTTAQNALATAQQQWQAQQIGSYRYGLAVSCFCPEELRQPVVITVTAGETNAIVTTAGGAPVTAAFFDQYNTVDKLFALIQQAIAEGADEVAVTYDPTLGYPTEIKLDGSTQIADDERFLTISDLQATPGGE